MFGSESESGQCKASDQLVLLNDFYLFTQRSTITSILDGIRLQLSNIAPNAIKHLHFGVR